MKTMSCNVHCQKKRYESCHWGGTLSKRYTFVPKGCILYHEGTNVHPLGTNVYLLKRYRPSDSFRTFFSDSEGRVPSYQYNCVILLQC